MSNKPSYQELEARIKELEVELDRTHPLSSAAKKSSNNSLPDSDILYPLIQSLPLNIYAKSTTGHFIFANTYYCQNLKKDLTAILHKTDYELHPSEHADKYLADDKKVMATKDTMTFEEEWKSIEGKSSYVHVIKSPIFDNTDHAPQKEVIGTLGIFWDITQRKLSEISLQQSEEKHRNIIENINEGYFELDRNNTITFFNESFCTITGLDEKALTGLDFLELFDAPNRTNINASLTAIISNAASQSLNDIQLTRKDETPAPLELSLSPIIGQHEQIIGIRGVARDISERLNAEKEREKLESQLHQNQKLESLGTLAGGIAHDFNNILFLISGYTDLALLDTEEQKSPRDKLLKIRSATERATELVAQILTFSRHSEKEYTPLNLIDAISETIKLLRAALPANISIEFDHQERQPLMVEADKTELHQVLMNLGINSGHAIGQDSGNLTFSLKTIDIDSRLAQSLQTVNTGRHTLLSISDTGCGMPADTLKRIFEPFFTTRETGKGTGLGLSVVHGIISNMQGATTVYSQEGAGTTFNIYIPLHLENADKQRNIAPTEALIKGKGEHILLIDDDESIRQMVSNMLIDLNYRCTTASDGVEGYETYKRSPEKFAGIITDQTMPIMSGIEMSKKIMAEFPNSNIMLCTGFSRNLKKEDIDQTGIKAIIHKPVLLTELSKHLYSLLLQS